MIERNREYYSDELLKSTYSFDGKENNYCKSLIDRFNKMIKQVEDFKNIRLQSHPVKMVPKNVIWIDASEDNLPATRESCRIVKNGVVVNTRKELRETINSFSSNLSETLLLSQCVKKDTYDVQLCKKIEEKGVVVSPGEITAPGSLFSDKLKTYKLLSENRKRWDLVAKYYEVSPDGKTAGEIARKIIACVDRDTETNSFFIKPTEGGGGLGGFRLIKIKKSGKLYYIIPDLSRVSGEFEDPQLTPLTVDGDAPAVIDELWWIYNRFRSIKRLKKNYIMVDLKDKKELKKLLKITKYSKIYNSARSVKILTEAIEKFEDKFNKRYHPLVCHYIDFGSWGLRAHYRMTKRGIEIETIYARLFQIRFESDGIGYVGSDNISNKQTGELEIGRLIPINQLMVSSIGGKSRLYSILLKGAEAARYLITTLPRELISRVPIRVQFDLAPVAGIIGEGNADTARGFCLAQDFSGFVKNITEWYNNSISYYNFKKRQVRLK